MKNLVVVGAGTGGTIVANRVRRRLGADWSVTVVDPSPTHLYQPGLLFLPFGARDEAALQRGRQRTLRQDVRWVKQGVAAIDRDERVVVTEDGTRLPFDLLVLATGTRIRPDLTTGLPEAMAAGAAHDFYTLEGAQRLRAALDNFEKGRLVVNVVEMPIKCPVAPLEFLFLADDFFRRRGIRNQVELVYATPLDGAFTRPLASALLGQLLESKGIRVEAEFGAAEVDGEKRTLASYDERELPFDLLVSVPTHSGAALIEQAGLGNELAFIPTDKHTLAVQDFPGAFALGDATNLPSSKAGSVAHFQAEALEANLVRAVAGAAPEPLFDGHANCFIESGDGKALLIDFNYDVEPLPGRFPGPLGPMALMKETRMNHLGKLMFRPLYWNALLPGRPLPVSRPLSMSGKQRPAPAPQLTA